MRKFAAILLCGIFFFNWLGYRLLNDLMEQDATRRLDARLDQQQYTEDQLITIKIPLTDLAYFNNSAAFERSTGQIEVNGIPYRYVKRRIYHDSLEMRCIPDQRALQLRQSGNNYFDGLNDIGQQQGPGSASNPGGHKIFQSDPYICIGPMRMHSPVFILSLRGNPPSTDFTSLSLPTDDRPPAAPAA